MNKTYLWTDSKARLRFIRNRVGRSFNWLFLPGGPGLGSESLLSLLDILTLPGNVWLLDLPGDGSNSEGSISHWSQGILEAVEELENVILVGHSRGGMFLLSIPELEKKLKGLVLMDAAPDRGWQEEFSLKIRHLPLSEAEKIYRKHPNNENLKRFILAGSPLMFTKEGFEKGRKSLENLPYNYEAIQWTEKHFDPSYSAKWIPQKIPTLILSGSEDLPTPLKLFSEKKEYNRSNILMKEIKNAGHFPWIENPDDVAAAFKAYCSILDVK